MIGLPCELSTIPSASVDSERADRILDVLVRLSVTGRIPWWRTEVDMPEAPQLLNDRSTKRFDRFVLCPTGHRDGT